MLKNSFCVPKKCKVRRLSFFNDVELWRNDGVTLAEIQKRCKERDDKGTPSLMALSDHFNKHYPPTDEEVSRYNPERMAKELDDNIAECSRRIKTLGDSPNEMRIVSQLMDTQKRLLELKLQNQQMFIEREKTLPEQFNNLKEILKEVPSNVQEKILIALEKDVGRV